MMTRKLLSIPSAIGNPSSIHFCVFAISPLPKEAWELLIKGNERPSVVVVDGHLAADEGELSSGANFVRRVRSRPELKQLTIVGFSGDEFAIEDMESSGANAGFYKSKVRPLFDYLTAESRD